MIYNITSKLGVLSTNCHVAISNNFLVGRFLRVKINNFTIYNKRKKILVSLHLLEKLCWRATFPTTDDVLNACQGLLLQPLLFLV